MLYETPLVKVFLLSEDDILTTSDQPSSTPDFEDENTPSGGWL